MQIGDGPAFRQIFEVINQTKQDCPMFITEKDVKVLCFDNTIGLNYIAVIDVRNLLEFHFNPSLVNNPAHDDNPAHHVINFDIGSFCRRTRPITKKDSITLYQVAGSNYISFFKGDPDMSSENSIELKPDDGERHQASAEPQRRMPNITLHLGTFVSYMNDMSKLKCPKVEFLCFESNLVITSHNHKDSTISKLVCRKGQALPEHPEARVTLKHGALKVLSRMNTNFNACGIIRIHSCKDQDGIMYLETPISSFGRAYIHIFNC